MVCSAKRSGASRGFTLVELLVVIGIIAILISLLLPSLARARQQANAVAGLSNLRQIGQAINMYVGANQGYLPVGYHSYSSPNGNYQTWWPLLLKQYVGGDRDENAITMDYSKIPKVFRDPSAVMEGGNVHYSANPLLMPETTRKGLSGRQFTQSWKLTQIHPIDDIALIWDGVQCKHKNGDSEYASWTIDGQSLYFGGAAGYTRPTDAAAHNPITGQTTDSYTTNYPPAGDLRWRQLNAKACNLLFADGRAETMRKGSVRKNNIWPIRNRG